MNLLALLNRLGMINVPIDTALYRDLQIVAEEQDTSVDRLAGRLLEEAVGELRALDVARGRWRHLTARERQAVALVCAGLSDETMGRRLSLSPQTVKNHLRGAMHKLGLASRRQVRRAFAGFDFSAGLRQPLVRNTPPDVLSINEQGEDI